MKLSDLNYKRGLSQALVVLPCLLGSGLSLAAPQDPSLTEQANDAAGTVLDKASNAADQVRDSAGNAADRARNAASNAANSTRDAAANAADQASSAASNAANKATTATAKAAFSDSAKAAYTLTQWEIDASFILAQAIDSVKTPAIKQSLTQIKQNVENNIQQLSDLTRKLGKQPPEYSRDFKGFFMQGYTAIRGIATDKGILEAVHTNALLAVKGYELALKANLTPEARTLIQSIYEGKKKDLDTLVSLKS